MHDDALAACLDTSRLPIAVVVHCRIPGWDLADDFDIDPHPPELDQIDSPSFEWHRIQVVESLAHLVFEEVWIREGRLSRWVLYHHLRMLVLLFGMAFCSCHVQEE